MMVEDNLENRLKNEEEIEGAKNEKSSKNTIFYSVLLASACLR